MSPLASAVDALSCRFSTTCKASGPVCLFGGTKWVKQMELLHYSQVYNIIKDVSLNLEGKCKVKKAKTVSEVTTCARDNHEARRTRGAFTRWGLTQTVVMGNACTEGRKISLVLPSFFLLRNFARPLEGSLWPRSAGLQTRLCSSTPAALTRDEAWRRVRERDGHEERTRCERDRPRPDEMLRVLPVRANAPLSYNWLCCCARVRVSARGSLTTAVCHYRPWLLFTGTSWPVEVHLGGCSHLSGPGQGLKLIYRPLIWCLVPIVAGRLLIFKLYNVFALVNQPIRMFWPLLKILM